MSAQLRLSIKLFAAFVVILFGIPLLCYLYPQIVNVRLLGFPLHWLFLAVLFYPLTWLIAWIYVTKSIAVEKRLTEEFKKGGVNIDYCLDSAVICNSSHCGYSYTGCLRSEERQKRV
uniref:hypothetical protein n=1 Tax=Desulforadius tongensis TaxID=1216062 RepID=UPI00195A83E6|nr:hypothetical protein [Desulforadius tongensis]